MQMKPSSTEQVAEQPSAASVFPSSHSSEPSTMPLPHVSASTEQLESQPSPLTVLLSSQVSEPVTMPSPQIAVQALGVPVQE